MLEALRRRRSPARGLQFCCLGLFFAFSATCGPAEAGAGPRWLRLAPGSSIEVGQYSGEGLVVTPGQPASREVRIEPGSVLRFHTVAYHDEDPREAAEERTTFRVHLDGTEVFAAPQASALLSRGRWHELVLPSEGAGAATLEFSVEGLATQAAFLAPSLGPAEFGDYTARPWGEGRPNIVLFLADTFRADNLSAYGGEHGSAPGLDALAERSLTFQHAWSPAAWTLPSQASMMTGVYPRQHGAVRNRLPIEHDLTTIAELLAERGYRTGAVTDSGFVSAKFGFAQGFEWFEENSARDFRHTLDSAREFVARDDGRPFFLFVQTYRTHDPYLVGPEGDEAPWNALMERLEGTEDVDDALQAQADELRALYLQGVSGFDQLFTPWFYELEAHGCLGNGYLFFTSDHGEAFGEHEDVKHGGLLWEEKIRVPFLVLGSDLAPAQRQEPVTLVDFPATVAELVGLDALPEWVGRSIFAETEEERAVYAFGEELTRYPPHLAMIERRRKVMIRQAPEFLDEARMERAFDLAADPGETRDLKDAELGWPQALCHRLRAEIERLSTPLAQPAAMTLQRDLERQLRELGYAEE